jgi:hypothetical protein
MGRGTLRGDMWSKLESVAMAPHAPKLLAAALALLLSGHARGGDQAGPAPPGEGSADPPPVHWPIPRLRIGGELGYGTRRDTMTDVERVQNEMSLTLKVQGNTYLWEPWLARAEGSLSLMTSRNNNATYENDSSNQSGFRSVGMTGGLRLAILERSRFPLELHAERGDSRSSAELGQMRGIISERYGVRQRYMRADGDVMLGWERATQTSEMGGHDRQDRAQLAASEGIGLHRLQLTADRSRQSHEDSGEYMVLKNLTLQHNYAPASELSFDNMANVSRSRYHLRQGENQTGLAQLSSLAVWRPEERDITATASARVLGLEVDSSGTPGLRALSGNLNAGASYALSHAARMYASANLNLGQVAGQRTRNASESLGASYQPDGVELDAWRYSWNGAGAATNTSGGPEAGRQLNLQLGHQVSRALPLAGGAGLGLDASQAMSTTVGAPGAGSLGFARQLTHGAALWWNPTANPGEAMVRLSATDARSLGGRREFFQMINFQLSGSRATGTDSSWSGSLTIQGVRQGSATPPDTAGPGAPPRGFVSTSGGAITYHNGRLFGVRNLRLSSDVRLNNLPVVPVLGNVQELETAAWENRLDYFIGRTRLRLGTLIGRSSGLANGYQQAPAHAPARTTINRSIMFSLARGFGQF